jgi:hypothetical protein
MIELAADTLTQIVQTLAPILNSNFATSLLGAGAGACAGAYAAQKIAARANERADLLAEIRNTIGAFNLAVMIFNVCLTLKGQHIKALKETYDRKKNEFEDNTRRHNAGEPGLSYQLRADFETLLPIAVPIEKLENIVLEKLTNRRRAAIFSTMLTQTVKSLNEALAQRNRLIEDFRITAPHSQDETLQFYFGVPDQQTRTIDSRYGATIDAIHLYTDCCLYFSKAIADDLSMHGKNLKNNFLKKFKGNAPTIGSLKIEKDEYRRLLPDPREYASWDGVRPD